MSKSSQAFRTIREVADWLGVAAHVLRFWESKFPQIKPVKRAGGRRYYRPADIELVGGIKVLLHDRAMTIKAVQSMIRDDGQAAVAALSPPIDALIGGDVIDADSVEGWTRDAEAEATATPDPAPAPPPEPAITAPADITDDAQLLDGADGAEPTPTPSEPAPKDEPSEHVSASAPSDEMPEPLADGAPHSPSPHAGDPVAGFEDLPHDLTVSPAPPPPEAAPRPSFVALRHLQHLARTRNAAEPLSPASMAALRALCGRMHRDPGENAP